MSDLPTVLEALEVQLGTGAQLPSPLAGELAALRQGLRLIPLGSVSDPGTDLPTRGNVVVDPDPPQNPATEGGGEPTQFVGPIVVRTFAWGFHLEIPDETLKMILASANAGSTLLSIVSGISGPAAPFVAGLAMFISVAASACQLANVNGRGIFISMLWVVPGAFVPTPVP